MIFGGDVAAPVVPAMLKQALALPKSPFDRSRLMAAVALVAHPAPLRRNGAGCTRWRSRPRAVLAAGDADVPA